MLGLFAACDPEEGDGGDKLAPTCTVEVDAGITSKTTWGEECRFYEVKGYYTVSGELDILPGTEVIFDEKAGLEVDGGSLNAAGSEENPVVFRGKDSSKGYWAGIAFHSKATRNELSWVKLSDAGNTGYHFRYYGVLVRGSVKISNSSFSNISSDGIVADDGADLAGYAKNSFSDIDGYPLEVGAAEVGFLDGESTYAEAAGKPFVAVRSGKIKKSQTWNKQDVPLRFLGGTTSIDDSDAVLTLKPGLELVFSVNSGIYIENGALSAVGEKDQPIVMRGYDASKSYWYGLAFLSNASKNELAHVKLSDAGGSGHNFRTYGVLVTGRLKVSDSVFSNNGSEVAFIVHDGASIEGFANNRFENNGAFPISLPAHNLGELDSKSDFAGPEGKENGKRWILVSDPNTGKGYKVTKTQTWRRQNVPYRFAETVSIEDAATTVTVEEGTRLEFNEVKGIYVEDGTLVAKGSSDKPISFVGVDSAKGYWSGIYFKSNQSGNALDHAVVSGGGASGYHFNSYGVGVAGQLSLTNTEISNTSGPGLWINGGTVTPSDLAELRAQNTFSNNGDNGDKDIEVKP